MSKTFHFYSEYNLPVLLGIKAHNINELVENLKTIPDSSIYYHTHRFLKQHHFLIPEPPNDFAYWVRNVLNQRELGEIVASINIASLKSIEEIRATLLSSFEKIRDKDSFSINCSKGDEFQFMSCKTFCMPLRLKASTLIEFADILEKAPISTFYYHIFETQLRHGKDINDFAKWFKRIGKTELAEKIAILDPYTTTLEGLREDIIKLVRYYDRH